MKYYIKERHNPQIGIYYVAMGPMSVKEAQSRENTLYGNNIMRGYGLKEYVEKCYELNIVPRGLGS